MRSHTRRLLVVQRNGETKNKRVSSRLSGGGVQPGGRRPGRAVGYFSRSSAGRQKTPHVHSDIQTVLELLRGSDMPLACPVLASAPGGHPKGRREASPPAPRFLFAMASCDDDITYPVAFRDHDGTT